MKIPATRRTIMPGLTRYLSHFWTPVRIAGVARG
jgi:hypothetical protein